MLETNLYHMSNHEYHPLDNIPSGHSDSTTQDDDPIGRWSCVVDRRADMDEHFNFVEVHKSYAWLCDMPDANKLCVIRISQWNCWSGTKLGECVMLDKAQMIELRDRLNTMLEQM